MNIVFNCFEEIFIEKIHSHIILNSQAADGTLMIISVKKIQTVMELL